jgi:hypothetical protein
LKLVAWPYAAFLRRRIMKPSPAKPKAKRARVEGSGTEVMLNAAKVVDGQESSGVDGDA